MNVDEAPQLDIFFLIILCEAKLFKRRKKKKKRKKEGVARPRGWGWGERKGRREWKQQQAIREIGDSDLGLHSDMDERSSCECISLWSESKTGLFQEPWPRL